MRSIRRWLVGAVCVAAVCVAYLGVRNYLYGQGVSGQCPDYAHVPIYASELPPTKTASPIHYVGLRHYRNEAVLTRTTVSPAAAEEVFQFYRAVAIDLTDDFDRLDNLIKVIGASPAAFRPACSGPYRAAVATRDSHRVTVWYCPDSGQLMIAVEKQP
ncbi:MAG TPA: hypothetical protein VEA69_16395 [Tepidisphaeraceae bacterium]|nr:hypothetical protein [Tepidisphaeraceae bacterium]